MASRKIIVSYIVPMLILAMLLFSNYLSGFGIVEEWLHANDEIHRFISISAIPASSNDGEERISSESEEWSINGFEYAKDDSLA